MEKMFKTKLDHFKNNVLENPLVLKELGGLGGTFAKHFAENEPIAFASGLEAGPASEAVTQVANVGISAVQTGLEKEDSLKKLFN